MFTYGENTIVWFLSNLFIFIFTLHNLIFGSYSTFLVLPSVWYLCAHFYLDSSVFQWLSLFVGQTKGFKALIYIETGRRQEFWSWKDIAPPHANPAAMTPWPSQSWTSFSSHRANSGLEWCCRLFLFFLDLFLIVKTRKGHTSHSSHC